MPNVILGERPIERIGIAELPDEGGAYVDIDKYIDKLDQDRRDMESRNTDEHKKITEQFQREFTDVKDSINKLDAKLDKLTEVYKDNKRYLVTTVIAIFAVAVSVVSVFLQFMS